MSAGAARLAAGSALVASIAVAAASCSTSVDIGGAPDAGAPETSTVDGSFDAEPPADAGPALSPCDPCLMPVECGSVATCAPVGGPDGFCLLLCPNGLGCDDDDTCRSVTASTGEVVDACVPNAGACASAAPPPPQADGAPVEICGDAVGPTIPSSCRSCEKSASDCQVNGCYGGWWCNTDSRRCEKPPATCP